jgi:Ca2+-binding RTX toxin-like protein
LELTGARLDLLYGPGYLRGVTMSEAFEDTEIFASNVPYADNLVFPSQGAGEHYFAVAWDRSASVPAEYTLTVQPYDPAEITFGTAGSDYIHWQPGQRLVEGGTGNDALSFAFSSTQGLSFSVTGNGSGQVDINSFFSTGNGSDLVTRFAGIERLTGSSQSDLFMSDPPYLAEPVAVNARGLGGADRFYLGGARDYADGGGGRDTVTYAYAEAREGVTASLFAGRGWSGMAEGDRYHNIENLIGTDYMDFLTGDHGNNWFDGRQRNDTIMGNGGSDHIDGGGGIDVAVYSGNRADYYISDAPTVTRSNPGGNYTVPGIHVSDQRPGGGDGFDTLYDVEILRFADGDLIL